MRRERDEFSQDLVPVGMILVPERVVRVPRARSEPLGRCYLELTSFSSPFPLKPLPFLLRSVKVTDELGLSKSRLGYRR